MTQANSNTSALWSTLPFSECLDDSNVLKPRKILARDYKSVGAVPVVDQGQRLIGGWTDDRDAAIADGLPIIVFGDHTRTFKFVDFPFALGADGTQLLKPSNAFNPRFFYYACLNVTLPNRGYNRHFALLKEQELPRPEKREQERIAAVLYKIQRAIEIEEKLIASARELKQSTMRQVFMRGVRGEPPKDTEIGQIPESWDVKTLASFVTLQRGQDLPRAAFRDGVVPVIGATRVIGYHDTPNVKGPGVTVVRSGSSAGRPLYIEDDFWAHNVVLYVKDFHGNLPVFTYYKLCSLQLQQFRSGVAVPTLNRNTFSTELVAVPHIDEQREIAATLKTIDRKISVHERKRTTLQELFNTLLHRLMTGQIRVDNIDIDTSEVEAEN